MKPDHDKSKSRGKSFDMSPEAVLRRIEICGELSDACRKLAKVVPVDPKSVRSASDGQSE